jgi:acyl phosphate:glycerol-3-phosphate acyltransferase
MLREILFVFVCYLVGAFPHLYLLGRLKGLRLSGDLHMALWREGGRPLGTIGFLLELVKGISVVLIGRALSFDIGVVALGGLAVVLGQMWPVFYHFDGEKGNSIGAAMSLTLTPVSFLIAFVFMLTGYLIRTVPRFLVKGVSVNEKMKLGGPPSNSFPLGNAVCFLVLPIAAWLLGEPPVVVGVYILLFFFIMLRRATAGITADIKARKNLRNVIVNRLLFDRADA